MDDKSAFSICEYDEPGRLVRVVEPLPRDANLAVTIYHYDLDATLIQISGPQSPGPVDATGMDDPAATTN